MHRTDFTLYLICVIRWNFKLIEIKCRMYVDRVVPS